VWPGRSVGTCRRGVEKRRAVVEVGWGGEGEVGGGGEGGGRWGRTRGSGRDEEVVVPCWRRARLRSVGDRLRALADELPQVFAVWEAARARRDAAARRRDAARRRAERSLRAALGGMSLRRWLALVNGESSIRSAAAGREAALARRRAPEVEAALGALEVLAGRADPGLGAAEDALAAATARLLAYGRTAAALTGVSPAELRRMAEPSRPEHPLTR
jgi:hypothetical protein